MSQKTMFNQIFWEEHQIDYLLVCQDINRFWLTEFNSSYGYVLLGKDSLQVAQIFLDARYLQEGKQFIKGYQVLPITNFKSIWSKLKGKVGFEMNLNYNYYQVLQKLNPQLILKSVNFGKFRTIKTEKEINQMRKVCQITANVWKAVLVNWKKITTEIELEKFIMIQALQLGVRENSFFPIVSSGSNSALIHTRSKDEVIKDHLLCDFGFKLNGYCSDFTRCIIINSNSKLRKYWQIVQEIQKTIIAKVKPGVKIADLAKLANNMYEKYNLKLEHAIGHGIGLDVHEHPMLTVDNNEVLQSGMIFTVEPGIYLPKIGGVRIEDVVLVTKDGHEVLTKV